MSQIKIYFIFISFFAAACSTSPTGRRQLTLMPEKQMSAMGVEAFEDMKSKIPVAKDPATQNYVQCVVNELIEQVPGKNSSSDWEVVIFDTDEVNAFALPGGKIGVYRGLINFAKSPDQLAAVLGHEIGHVLANHSNARVSESLAARTSLNAVSSIFANQGQYYELIMAGLGVGAQYGILMPHGRAQESEADLIGLRLMAQAGFHPRESIELWKNMATTNVSRSPEFLSTHPSPQTRIENLERHMKEAIQIAKRDPNGLTCNVRTSAL